MPIQIREMDMYANVACTVDTNSVHTYTANRKSATANFKHLTFVFFESKVNPARNQEKDVFLSKHSLTNTKFRSVQTPGTGVPTNNAQ